MNEKVKIVEGKIIETSKPNEIYLALFDQGYGWQVSGVMYHTPDEVAVNLAAFNPKQIVIVKVEMPEKYECGDEGKSVDKDWEDYLDRHPGECDRTGTPYRRDEEQPKIETTKPEEAIADEAEKVVEDMTTKELVESGPTQSNPVAHVEGEKIRHHNGILAYSPRNDRDGRIILDSIVFRMCRVNCPEIVIGTVDKMGKIIPSTREFGLVGIVTSEGSFAFNSKGVNFDKDEINVSYDYEYTPPKG